MENKFLKKTPIRINKFTKCIFCRIVNGQENAYVIWQNKTHIAFLSIFPNTLGTTVVIPKLHKDSYLFADSNTDEDIQNLMCASRKVANILDSKLEDVGRTGIIFEGFGVNHLHAKLYPMHGTKVYKKNWSPIISKRSKYFDKYLGYISSHDGPPMSYEDLAKLCKKLKEKH